MKAALSEQKGIQILSVDGPISVHNFQVLRAGVTKLFKDGKNRIVLELNWNKDLDDQIIRDFGVLNLLARELSGELMLSITDPNLRSKIENFAKPNVVKVYETKAQAFEAMLAQKTAPTKHEERDDEIRKLKEQLKAKEGGELSALKTTNARLQDENSKFEDQLLKTILQRRVPADEQGFVEKIRSLEQEVEGLLAKVASLEDAKAKSP